MNHLREAYENGKKISPKLPEGKKNFLIDIDGTICEDIPNEEPERMATAAIYEGALEICNSWFDEGHIITIGLIAAGGDARVAVDAYNHVWIASGNRWF